MIYVVMGVSGAGKTLIGSGLAKKLGIAFYDADDFHPQENVGKMSSGQPLTDRDRLPWLQLIARQMTGWEQTGGAVLACSALKESYRTLLSPPGIPVRFIYLKGSRELVARRISGREEHFMPESLLDSQFDTLEEPLNALAVSIDQPPDKIVDEILRRIQPTPGN